MKRQRLKAAGHVSAKCISAEDGQSISVLNELYQQGSARIRFPHQQPDCVHAVLLNTAGGLTGDDFIQWHGSAGCGSRMTMTTAACEKIYRTHGPAAVQATHLHINDGARLSWLPQETIAFDGSRLKRSLNVHLTSRASCLLVESIVLGRQAMNESFDHVSLHDRWRIYREHRLLHAEDFRINSKSSSAVSQVSGLHQFSAMSTVVLVSDKPDDWFSLMKERIRSRPERNQSSIRIAVTQLPNRLVIRVLANSSFYLRQFLIPCIESLNDGESIPRVWTV